MPSGRGKRFPASGPFAPASRHRRAQKPAGHFTDVARCEHTLKSLDIPGLAPILYLTSTRHSFILLSLGYDCKIKHSHSRSSAMCPEYHTSSAHTSSIPLQQHIRYPPMFTLLIYMTQPYAYSPYLNPMTLLLQYTLISWLDRVVLLLHITYIRLQDTASCVV